jgi:hypothetical protein
LPPGASTRIWPRSTSRSHDAAIDILEQLLTTTYVGHMTRHNLRIGPWWDPLREHVRFKALLQEQT